MVSGCCGTRGDVSRQKVRVGCFSEGSMALNGEVGIRGAGCSKPQKKTNEGRTLNDDGFNNGEKGRWHRTGGVVEINKIPGPFGCTAEQTKPVSKVARSPCDRWCREGCAFGRQVAQFRDPCRPMVAGPTSRCVRPNRTEANPVQSPKPSLSPAHLGFSIVAQPSGTLASKSSILTDSRSVALVH
jgi:hypothetical protein